MADRYGSEVSIRDPVNINGIIYIPASTPHSRQKDRSRVQRFDDPKIKTVPEFKYGKLPSMRRRIRLLRLKAGTLDNPQIDCELFEIEYDDQNVAREVTGSATIHALKKAQPQMRRASTLLTQISTGFDGDDGPTEDDKIEYEALSWCWGTESNDHAIMIHRGKGIYRFAATRELSLALKYLRLSNRDRTLWIDAICINQKNHEERNHQVQMMSMIYSLAKQVCVWLGEDNDDSTTAIKFIEDEIMKLENFDSISSNRKNALKWQSLLMLMQRPWFRRRWVVQEIALAQDATVYCGQDQLPWKNFAVAVELFVEVETATHRLSEVMLKEEAFNHVPGWFEHVSELGASLLVQATGKVFRQYKGLAPREERKDRRGMSRDSSAVDRVVRNGLKPNDEDEDDSESPMSRRGLLSLEYLVSSLFIFDSTQPRDAVYSLLAIARDTSPIALVSLNSADESNESLVMSTFASFLERKPFTVDYSRPYSDVCKDFVAFCIHRAQKTDPSRALDILCRPWAPDNTRQGNVVHKKAVAYKQVKKRKALWKSSGKPKRRRQVGDGTDGSPPFTIVDDERSLEQYWHDVEANSEYDIEKWRQKFRNYLPKKAKVVDMDDDDDEAAHMDSREENQHSPPDEDNDLDLPSWVSSIDGAPFALFPSPGMHILKMGRKNADPLVGLPEDGHRNYSAAQNTSVDPKTLKFRKRPVLGHYSLYVKGFILDVVETVAEPSRLGSIPANWTKVGGWKDALDGKQDPPSDFWRTLVADRGKDNRNPPYYYAKACKESVSKGGLLSGSVDTKALINSERNSIIAEFCRRVQGVIWNRSLIRTKKQILGLAGQNVKAGDLVCIILGCTVPVILRRHKMKNDNELKAEEFEDAFESMKDAMAICEQACFRKLRYQKALANARKKGAKERELYEREVKEERKEVNELFEQWLRDNEEDAERRRKAEEKWKAIKNAAEERKKKRDAERPMKPVNLRERSEDTRENGGEDGMRKDKEQEQVGEDKYWHYTFLGESYIHGMMDGEAMRQRYYDNIPEHVFELR
jgi:hypothetical protein